MEDTITVEIPEQWLQGLSVNQDELRQALMLGLEQLRHRLEDPRQVEHVLLRTNLARHLAADLVPDDGRQRERQLPPELPGQPVSEILIAQRRGES